MQPDYKYLIEKTGIEYPVIGFYDTPDPKPFEPYINTESCVFTYFKLFLKGKYIRLTRKHYGCGGAGKWLCNVETRTKEQYVKFLADEEGLKANHQLMREWLEYIKPYQQNHENLLIGALKESEYKYLKTVTFFVNPDQLSILMIGAQLHSSPNDPVPVISPFGSGCMQLVSLFKDLNVPQAIIGATDMAMRKYLPPNILAFTVTKPMLELLCTLGKDSYLEKSFIKGLKRARKSW
jgi:hypothetical protein